jgi:transposase
MFLGFQMWNGKRSSRICRVAGAERGARWKDCPAVYGPYTTIYNRWNRWSRQGVWERVFYALTGSTGVFTGSVDSTHIKAHRSAAGAKGGLSSRHWRLAGWANDENPCVER